MRIARLAIVGLVGAALVCGCGKGGRSGRSEPVRLATTTSVKDSGLLDVLLPAFEKKTGQKVEVSAVGSGKAIEMLAGGSADVAITHSPADEAKALDAGRVGARTPIMRNAFVIVGPPDAATTIAGAGSAREVLKRIAASGRHFISRGDSSGTNQRERQLWAAAEIDPKSPFIDATGQGMAATLQRASSDHAFTLTDRGTYLARRKELELVIVYEGGEELANIYSVLEPKGDAQSARSLRDFLRSAEGRAIIGGFGVKDLGEPLFTPADSP